MNDPLTPTSETVSETPKENKRLIGRLWTKLGNSGNTFLSGNLSLKNLTGSDDKVEIMLFKVNDKKSDTMPDYELVLSTNEMVKRAKGKSLF